MFRLQSIMMKYIFGEIHRMKPAKAAVVCLSILAVLSTAPGCAPKQSPEERKKEIQAGIREFLKENPGEVLSALQQAQESQRQVAEEAELKMALANRVDVPVGQSPAMGPADAKLTIIEFSDFQCPYCARSLATINQLMERHKGNVRLVFKNAPLPFHDKAPAAAKAAMAAGLQGKFWEFRAKLLTAQNEWGQGADPKQVFVKYAKEMGLDTAKFTKDMADPSFDKQLEEDKALTEKVGVNGTPTYFINGIRITGARDLAMFEKVIALAGN